jgi:hypothetical protein
MVTTAIDPHSVRTRWLRRSAAAAIATAVLGVTGTGLAVGIISARQPDSSSGGTQAASSDDSSSSDSGSGSGSSSDSDGSGLGSAQQDAPAQGGSNGS